MATDPSRQRFGNPSGSPRRTQETQEVRERERERESERTSERVLFFHMEQDMRMRHGSPATLSAGVSHSMRDLAAVTAAAVTGRWSSLRRAMLIFSVFSSTLTWHMFFSAVSLLFFGAGPSKVPGRCVQDASSHMRSGQSALKQETVVVCIGHASKSKGRTEILELPCRICSQSCCKPLRADDTRR